MPHHDQSIAHSQSMQPPPSPSIPIDPALSIYPAYYPSPGFQQGTRHLPPHLAPAPTYSSPSSQGSDTLGTPPLEHVYPSPSYMNGKRPASLISNVSTSDSRKKARKDDGTESMAEKDEPKAKPTRGSRACTVCRRLKMKCVGAEQGGSCKRCLTGNHECIFEESNRGKRSSKKHEILTRSLRKMERTLDTVLRSIGNPSLASGMVSRSPSPSGQAASTQALLASSPSPAPAPASPYQLISPASPKLHSLPDNSLNPLGLLAEASLANRRTQNPYASPLTARDKNPRLGVAADNYFKPGPMTILPLRRLIIERQVQPEMLTFVSTDDVVALFNIFFDHINMHCRLLDRNFHTPSLVCSRSPFLLTTICSIASKFYTAKPELHPRLTELAKKLAFSVPAKGYKSVEIVQAYILLSLWGCGAAERYEQDKTWLLLGMGIRMAIDLNLHRKTAVTSDDTQEGKARDFEVHNRERTWLLCYCLDRSLSAQMGKPHSIKEDSIIRNAMQWCQSAAAIPSDGLLAAYSELQRVLSRCLDFLYSSTETASGLHLHCDYMLIIKTFEAQMFSWRQQYSVQPPAGLPAPEAEYTKLIASLYFHYTILVLNSFGLQNALERSPADIGHFFARCHSAATTCALIVRDELSPRGYMRYAPDSHFVFTSYAVLSLLKLIRPEFQAFLDNEQSALSLVQDVADTLESIAANSTHTPALYSTFLRALLSAKSNFGNKDDNDTGIISDAASAHGSYQNPSLGDMRPPSAYGQQHLNYSAEPPYLLNEFQFESEMGPVADMSTFPPTMAPNPSEHSSMGSLTMDNILSSGFWDSVLVPGYNNMDGLSGGFVFGIGGSGLITPQVGGTPDGSGSNTPARLDHISALTQMSINTAFNNQMKDGNKINSSS